MMRKAKTLVFLAAAFELVFVHAQELDLSKINPLVRHNLFYSVSDNWSPPTLPHESNNSFSSDKKWGLSIGYSPGICIRGDNLRQQSPPGQEFSLDLLRNYYLINTLIFEVRYNLNSQWSMGFGPQLFLGSMSETSKVTAMIEPSNDPSSEPWIHRNLYWNIAAAVLGISLQYTYPNYTYLKLGVELYNTTGEDHEKAYRWDSGLQHDVEQFINASNKGHGFGFSTQAGHSWRITSNLMWDVSLGIRIGRSWEYSHSVPQGIVWGGPVDLSFSGLIFRLGVSYMLF